LTVIKAFLLSKMERGSDKYFTTLERFLEQLQRQTGTTIGQTNGEADAATAQTSADNAGAYAISVPPGHNWISQDDGSGTFTAGNPTRDIVTTFYNKSKTSIAVRTLRGTLTTAAGTIAVTNVSNSGLTTSFALTDDASDAVKADITVTFGDGSKLVHGVSWTAGDISAALSIPSTGGGK